LVWPAQCLSCGERCAASDRWLCQACWADLLFCTGGTSCPRCARDASPFALVDGACPGCLGRESVLSGIARCGVYQAVLRDLILAFKNGRTELDVVLACLAQPALEASPFFGEIDLLVPVPLHWMRRLARGYNQAAVVARRLSHPKARVAKVLVRARRTAPQTAMVSPAARLKNVRGAFAVGRRADLAGRTLCLVDDIKTTGATLCECARVLRLAGAARVYALVLAVAGQVRT